MVRFQKNKVVFKPTFVSIPEEIWNRIFNRKNEANTQAKKSSKKSNRGT